MAADSPWLREVTLQGIKAMMDALPPRPPRRELHCHPDLLAVIKQMAAAEGRAEWASPLAGLAPFTSVELVEDAALRPGGLELYEDGQLVKRGVWRDSSLVIWDAQLAGW